MSVRVFMIKQLRIAVFGGLLIAAAGIGPAQKAPAGDPGTELRDRTLGRR